MALGQGFAFGFGIGVHHLLWRSFLRPGAGTAQAANNAEFAGNFEVAYGIYDNAGAVFAILHRKLHIHSYGSAAKATKSNIEVGDFIVFEVGQEGAGAGKKTVLWHGYASDVVLGADDIFFALFLAR